MVLFAETPAGSVILHADGTRNEFGIYTNGMGRVGYERVRGRDLI